MENNFVLKFQALTQKNVVVGTFKEMKLIYGYPQNVMQMRPDLLSNWKNSSYQYKGYLGVDQKFNTFSDDGRNQVIIMSEIAYEALMMQFSNHLFEKFGDKLDNNVRNILQQLIITSSNFYEHLNIWSDSAFPDKWKPPLRLEKSFDYSNLNPEILDLIRRGDLVIEKVSEYLYTANINTETGSLPEQALVLFYDSEIPTTFVGLKQLKIT